MVQCSNCGKANAYETNYCRFCGTKMTVAPLVPQPLPNPFDHPQPRPYAWKTDELQTHSDARKTMGTEKSGAETHPFENASQQYAPAPLAYHAPYHLRVPFRCPHCTSQLTPRIERRISTAGWITFAVLLVVFFPLFWIGLLIKEDVAVCQTCNASFQLGPHR